MPAYKEQIARAYVWLANRSERAFGCTKEQGEAARDAANARLNEYLVGQSK